MSAGLTYDFTTLAVRDLSDLIADILVGENLGFLNLFSEGPAPINVKHEWSDDDIKAQEGTLNGAKLAADTTFTVDDSGVFMVQDIVTPVSPAGVSSLERIRVLTIPDATTITVERGIGAAAANIADDSTLKIVARPKVENNKDFTAETTLPSSGYNYTQIFERAVEISRTQQTVKSYSMGNDTLAYQEMLRMKEIMVELNRALIWGVRYVGTAVQPRRMGGLIEFATKINLADTLDSPTQINDVSEAIVKQGGKADALICNTDIARKISAFNSGTALQTRLEDRDAGSFVVRFVGDTPVTGIQAIAVDTDFPRDMLGVLDTSRLEKNTLMPFQSINGTVNGQDGQTRVIRGEVTSTWKNAAKVQRVIHGITL